MIAMKRYIDKLHKAGFSSIVLTGILSNIVTFVGGIILVHILSKNDYGNYTYVQNTFNILVIVGDLGISSATMQFASENYKESAKLNAYINYGFKMMLLLAMLPSAVVLTSYWWYPHTIAGTESAIRNLFLVPVFQNINLFLLNVLRIHLKNNQYAIINILNCISHYIFIILFAFEGGWMGAVLSKYPATIIMMIISVFFVKNVWGREKSNLLSKKEKIEYIKLAFVSQANAVSSTLMNILDVYCVGWFVADSSVIASYKIASVLPTALNFIPQSVMVFAVPYFGRNCRDKKWVRENYKKVSVGLLAVSTMVAVIGILGASFIVPFIFGEEYKDAIPCFIVLLVGFIFYSGLQCPATNVLYTQRKVKSILVITVLGALGNTVLNVILINVFGSIGAALATTVVHIAVGIIVNVYLRYVLKEEKVA